MSRSDSINLVSCPFWVQVHGLTLGSINDKMGHAIGKVLGHVEKVETKDYCFVCGCLDHFEIDCLIAMKQRREHGMQKREYGSWLRAEGPMSWTVKQNGSTNVLFEGSSTQSSRFKDGDRRNGDRGKRGSLEMEMRFLRRKIRD
ncbi:hypothetical protein REPUB_Repub08aG0032800 [Reevesia pubescens]